MLTCTVSGLTERWNHESRYGCWLREVLKQLADSDRALGDRQCQCEKWETKMHKLLKFGPSSVILRTENKVRDITLLAVAFAGMKIPDEGWLITDRRIVFLSIFGEFAFRAAMSSNGSTRASNVAAAQSRSATQAVAEDSRNDEELAKLAQLPGL